MLPEHPVQIAEGIWWVGHELKDDPFQCHAYLIVDGDDCVLVDPGSPLTFAATRRKIEQIVPFERIRYFICHHQDPDIAASLPEIDTLVTRPDAAILAHWRSAALLKHYNLRLPFWLVEDHGWKLELPHRELAFIFTPYLHFAGAFCTLDRASGTLFSSDLFGGFTRGGGLYAEGPEYFEEIRAFHEHYMPSQDILAHGLSSLEQYDIRQIAPQHGRIIPGHLVTRFINGLKQLQCGIYLLAGRDTRITHLIEFNAVLREIVDDLVFNRDFDAVATALLETLKRILPIETMSFYAIDANNREEITLFADWNRFRGVAVDAGSLDPAIAGRLSASSPAADEGASAPDIAVVARQGWPAFDLLIVLPDPMSRRIAGLAVLSLADSATDIAELRRLSDHLDEALGTVLSREMIRRTLETERQAYYEASIRDALTGLYNRYYMREMAKNLFQRQDREPTLAVDVAVFDIDHFKRINDSLGHDAGDRVLIAIADVLKSNVRGGDVPTRFGGEEFVVLLPVFGEASGRDTADRIRMAVAAKRFDGELGELRVTISAGVARRRRNETLDEVIARADRALYRAKESGRDRVVETD